MKYAYWSINATSVRHHGWIKDLSARIKLGDIHQDNSTWAVHHMDGRITIMMQQYLGREEPPVQRDDAEIGCHNRRWLDHPSQAGIEELRLLFIS
jgi:hypothetical protein